MVAHHVSEGFALQNWMRRFAECDVTRVVVYGDPNAAARAILDRLATYHSAWGGFARL